GVPITEPNKEGIKTIRKISAEVYIDNINARFGIDLSHIKYTHLETLTFVYHACVLFLLLLIS
uniref:hypothetical protein n=1 Tax=Cellvibrio fontiphilus TaxID=1815559 RepID=UPI002B4BA8D3